MIPGRGVGELAATELGSVGTVAGLGADGNDVAAIVFGVGKDCSVPEPPDAPPPALLAPEDKENLAGAALEVGEYAMGTAAAPARGNAVVSTFTLDAAAAVAFLATTPLARVTLMTWTVRALVGS